MLAPSLNSSRAQIAVPNRTREKEISFPALGRDSFLAFSAKEFLCAFSSAWFFLLPSSGRLWVLAPLCVLRSLLVPVLWSPVRTSRSYPFSVENCFCRRRSVQFWLPASPLGSYSDQAGEWFDESAWFLRQSDHRFLRVSQEFICRSKIDFLCMIWFSRIGFLLVDSWFCFRAVISKGSSFSNMNCTFTMVSQTRSQVVRWNMKDGLSCFVIRSWSS
jgi:hypothetical protein